MVAVGQVRLPIFTWFNQWIPSLMNFIHIHSRSSQKKLQVLGFREAKKPFHLLQVDSSGLETDLQLQLPGVLRHAVLEQKATVVLFL